MTAHHNIRTKACLALTAGLFLFLGVGRLHAATATWHVTPGGLGDGTNWAAACSLTYALANAAIDDDIWIADGEYTNASNPAFDIDTDGLSLYGGFTNGMATFAERDWDAYPAILNGESARRVVTIGEDCTLDGLVISNGYTSTGAGLYANGTYNIVLNNCLVTRNDLNTRNYGAGAAFLSATVSMSNTVFRENLWAKNTAYGSCGYAAGGFYGNAADITIVDCVFTNNGSDNFGTRDGNMGGAFYMTGGSLDVSDTLFVDNKFYGSWNPGDGGGAGRLYNVSPASFNRCTFLRNRITPTATTRDCSGGALVIEHASSVVTIENCLFVSNYTTYVESHGGAVYVEAGTVGITNCLFVNNETDYQGGAIHVAGGTLTVANSILYGNATDTRGSDVSLNGGSATFSHCRLSGLAGSDAVYDESGGITLSNVMTNDPLFADAGDYHLKSPHGRWNGSSFVTTDTELSPCIDAGDPSHSVGAEVAEHGGRINVGLWGGTAEASKSPAIAPVIENRSVSTNLNLATIRGELVDNATIAAVTLYYGQNTTVTNTDTAVAVYPPQQTGTVFQASLSGLEYSTTYYYRWHATNAYGEDWANTVSNFTTGAEPPGGGPTIIHVNKDAAGGGTGDNWFNAFTSLADAMDAVNNPNTNEIWVAAGSYDDAEVVISEDANIYGGFVGDSETTREERDVSANVSAVNGSGIRRCVQVTGGTVLLDGLSITNGRLSSHGAGIYASGFTALTIANCTIWRNDLANQSYGGGAYFNGGTVTMTNTVFDNNIYGKSGSYGSVGREGGGFWANNTDVQIVDCVFTNNGTASYGSRDGKMGGAFYMTGGSVAVTNTLFVDNKFYGAWTPGDGGGACRLYNVSPARFVECTFLRNRITPNAATRDASGGAVSIEHSSSDVVFDHCLFVSNYTTYVESHGGAVYVEAGTVGITNCTFVNNRTDYQGGALHVAGGTVTLQDSILTGSETDTRGKDIALSGGSLTVSYCRTGGDEGTDWIYDGSAGITTEGILTVDPLFAGGGDYHLKSQEGRYDPSSGWVTDGETSLCIDGGKPGDVVTYTNEPPPHGSRVNLGRYGNTDEASMTYAVEPIVTNVNHFVTYNQVTLQGQLVVNDAIASVRFYYGYSDWNWEGVVELAGSYGMGTVFSNTISGLDYSTDYYWRAHASNSVGTSWASNVMMFTTGAEPAGGGSTIIHVKKDAVGGGTGVNWFDAFTSVNDAMAAVNPGTSEVWVAAGTYDDATLSIATNVSIYGGFLGDPDTGETTRGERDVSANGRPVITGVGERRCVNITDGTVLLDGLAVTNGSQVTQGAGIRASGAGIDLTIADCRIEHNDYSVNVGGCLGFGLYLNSATCYITNSVIANNTFSGGYVGIHYGVGIYGSGASLSMVDCTVTNNVGSYWGTRNSEGGAMWFNNCTVGITNSTISDNQIGSSNGTTDGGGAAKIIGGSQVEFRNCVFKNNRTGYYVGQQAYGGCMILDTASTDVDLVNCTVVDSFARDEGGAFYVLNGNLLLKDCILWNNNCTNEGSSHNRGYDIKVNSGSVTAEYSNLSGDKDSDTYIYVGGGSMTRGDGLQWVDPKFASDFDDVHLKSEAGRWDPSAGGGSGAWVTDGESSLCIDKGEAGDVLTYTNEPAPHGDRVNLGAYGNTWQASKTVAAAVPVVTNIGHGFVYNYVTITGELVVVDTSADVSIYYGKTDWVWDGYFQPSPATQEDGIPFSASKGDLDYNTTYYYRCYATNASGDTWASNVLSFTTGAEPAGGPDTVIHVKSDAAGSQSGATWFDACHTLAAALAKVDGATNEIWIATSREAVTAEIDISTNVSIYGGFVGTENTRAERSLDNVAELAGDGTLRILDIGGGTVVLDGLTITNGAGGSSGYGLRASGTYDLTMANCLVTRCGLTDSDDGAGAYFSGGTVLLTNTTFDSNATSGYGHQGGGFYAAGADVTVVDCLFTNNGTPGYNGRTSDGGAIYQSGGTLTVIRSDFIGNDVGTDVNRYGGAVALVGNTSASFTNCVFRHNTCTFQDGRGDGSNGGAIGVVVNAGYTVTVVNCTFAYNTGANRGGAIHANSGATIIRNCILWGNEVSEVAGADATGEEIYARNAGTTVNIAWSDVTFSNGNYVADDGNAVITRTDLIEGNPQFASATDLHIKSTGGRWDPVASDWVNDLVDSQCLDAGDPTESPRDEVSPHGSRINMGAYGGTAEASRTRVAGLILIFK